MNLDQTTIAVIEAEIRVRQGLPLDSDTLDNLRKVETDTSVHQPIRVRAARAASRGAL